MPDVQCGRPVRGPVEAFGRDEQRPRGVEVGVRRRLVAHDAPARPAPLQETVRALQVAARPAPDARELRSAAGRGRQQQRVGLALADAVPTLIVPNDAPVRLDVAAQEPLDRAAAAAPVGAAARAAGERRERDQERHDPASSHAAARSRSAGAVATATGRRARAQRRRDAEAQHGQVHAGERHVVHRARVVMAHQAQRRHGHQGERSRQRRRHRPRLAPVRAALRRHLEAPRPPQQREQRRMHVDPERSRLQRERPERVRPRAHQRHHAQRQPEVGREMQQELVGRRRSERLLAREDPDDREGHVDQDGPARQEVRARQQVLQPHPQRQPRAQHGTDRAQAAARPAVLLAHVGRHVLRPQPLRQHLGHVRAAPAAGDGAGAGGRVRAAVVAVLGLVPHHDPSTMNNVAFACVHLTVLSFGVARALRRGRDGRSRWRLHQPNGRARRHEVVPLGRGARGRAGGARRLRGQQRARAPRRWRDRAVPERLRSAGRARRPPRPGRRPVSEGQSYVLLLTAATGRGAQFARVWGWTRSHLQRPDGLLAWHWAGGRIVGRRPGGGRRPRRRAGAARRGQAIPQARVPGGRTAHRARDPRLRDHPRWR